MTSDLCSALTAWYQRSARELPWREVGTTPWGVLVSEVMLQQTPVNRVLPVYLAWMRRWQTPAGLASASAGDAVRMWGTLGYPRRALRLHACAGQIVERFEAEVPQDLDQLLSLPGIGSYTARAVATFAFGQRHAVLDTNVRRVVARVVHGQGAASGAAGGACTSRDLSEVEALLPTKPAAAAQMSIAMMELGAVICTARAPRCAACPIAGLCAWLRAGAAPYQGPIGRRQRFAGTDRQVRGRLLAVVRATPNPVTSAELDIDWPDRAQLTRALDSLVADGLIAVLADHRYALPT